MSLYLTGKNITFIPNQHELVETFKIIIEEITHLISTIPRLYEKFGLPAGGLKKFTEVIKTDVDSNKLQTLINAGTYWNNVTCTNIKLTEEKQRNTYILFL